MSESPEANLPLLRFPLTVSPWRNARRKHEFQRLRRIAERNPHWGLMVLAAGAWVFLAAAPRGHAGHGGAHGDGWTNALGLAAMVVAMMLPLTIGRALHLARSSPWRRRHRAVTAFLAGYVAVWMLAMVLINVVWRLAASRTGWITAAVAAAGAAVLWEFAPRNLLQPTHGSTTTSREWRTSASCARLGVTTASVCVASCWALMAACVALAHSLPVMMGLFCVQLIGRHRPAASRTATALAVLVICAGSPVPGPPHHVTAQTRQDSGREASRPESRCVAFRREPLAVHVARHYSAGRRDSSPPAHSRHAHQPAAPVLAL
jgi:hypothetical protein